MSLPKVTKTYRTERDGVIAVAAAVNDLGHVWRETPSQDVGVDGQIEYVSAEGHATGRIVAVQVKSGRSYFTDLGSAWGFTPEKKHREYWERFPVPVLIVLHDPDTALSYWTDIRQAVRSPYYNGGRVEIPKANVLQNANATDLFGGYAASNEPFLGLEEVLDQFVRTRCPNASFPISYFDLFCHGLTNICRSIHHGMDVAVTVAEVKLAMSNSPTGVGFGEAEQEFIFGFVKALVHQHLADVNFADCLIDWHEQQMQPSFTAPLTSRGRALVRMISDMQDSYEKDGHLKAPAGIRCAQEDFVQMVFAPSHYQRVPLVEAFAAERRRERGDA